MNTYTLSILALCPALAFAAGPLTIQGSNGTTPVKYENPNVVLNFDIGTLGLKTPSEADALILDGLALWNGVSTSTINLTQGTDLSVDVDSSNYTSFMPEDTADTTFADGDGLNPVIYDTDGSIIDAFFGAGQSDLIAGFATSIFLLGGSFYAEGYAVINGKVTQPSFPFLDDTQLTLLIAHEMGHFAGFDHTLIHIVEDSASACTTKIQSIYPLMYPFICRDEKSLHQDDIISASTLYPSSDINTQFGQINGNFTQLSGSAILGTNIYARNTVTSDVYSVISDYLKQGTGFFSMYLPPGTYTLHANSLNPDFTSGSSVGPYSFELTDASFLAPNPITAVSFDGSTAGSNEMLPVIAGEATVVQFKLDGSGTFTTGGTIFTPATSAAAAPATSSDNGSITPATLMLLLTGTGLRLLRRRPS